MEENLTKDERKKLRQEEFKENLKKQETRNKLKKVGFWILGLCILVFSIWFIYAIVNSPSSTTPQSLSAPSPKSTDITYGNPNAKLILTEYADFQCPGCAQYSPVVNNLIQQNKDRMLFVYRFFPLSQIHQNAAVASEAGYAASLQNKFWPMHDLLFSHQTDWSTLSDPSPKFIEYASQAGLNVDQFKKDFNDPKTANYIKSQEQSALDIGLPGTPTFFLNNKQIVTPNSYEEFKKLIDQALANAK